MAQEFRLLLNCIGYRIKITDECYYYPFLQLQFSYREMRMGLTSENDLYLYETSKLDSGSLAKLKKEMARLRKEGMLIVNTKQGN